MIAKRVRAKGVLAFGDIDVKLKDGVYGLIGKNGAGKSSFFDLILLSLFDYNRDNIASIANIYLDPPINPWLEFTFEVNGQDYIVTRNWKMFGADNKRMSVTKTLSTLTYESGKKIATGTNVTKEIQKLLGRTDHIFYNTSFFLQDNQYGFTGSKPQERTEFLQKFFDLDIFAKALKNLRVDKNGAAGALKTIEGQISVYEDELEGLTMAKMKQDKESLSKQVTTLKNKLTKSKQIEKLRTSLSYEKDALSELEDELTEEQAVITKAQRLIKDYNAADIKRNLAEVNKSIAVYRKKLDKLKDNKQEYVTKYQQITKQLKGLHDKSGGSKCYICQSELTTVKRNKLIAEATAKQQEYTAAGTKIGATIKSENVKLTQLHRKNEMYNRHQDILTANTAKIKKQKTIVVNLKERVQEQKQVVSKMVKQLGSQKIRESISSLTEQYEDLHGKLTTVNNAIKSFSSNKIKLGKLKKERTALNDQLKYLRMAEGGLTKYGAVTDIITLILERAEFHTNNQLDELQLPVMVGLSPFTTTSSGKTGDGVEIWVHDKDKSRRFKTYSGGEKTLINWAMRIGLSLTLQEIHGVSVDLLFMDEVMAALDAENKDDFMKVLSLLKSMFNQVLCISHDMNVKSRLDNTLSFVKSAKGISKVVA